MKAEINKIMKEHGAKKSKSTTYHGFTHYLPTKIGALFFKLDNEGSIFSVLGRFLNDGEKAKKYLRSTNSKYNFHCDKKDPLLKQKLKMYIEHVK